MATKTKSKDECSEIDTMMMFVRRYRCEQIKTSPEGYKYVYMYYWREEGKEHVEKNAPMAIVLMFPPGEMPSNLKVGMSWEM